MASVTYFSFKQDNTEHKENLKKLEDYTHEGKKRRQHREALIKSIKESISHIDTELLKYEKYRKYFAIGYVAALLLLPSSVLAAGGAKGGIAIIKLMQIASFWVGIGVVVWGIVEAQLDLPGWKSRVLKGILGYIAILLVPILFITLRDNLQIDVWDELAK